MPLENVFEDTGGRNDCRVTRPITYITVIEDIAKAYVWLVFKPISSSVVKVVVGIYPCLFHRKYLLVFLFLKKDKRNDNESIEGKRTGRSAVKQKNKRCAIPVEIHSECILLALPLIS
jgi:hypothetical protein